MITFSDLTTLLLTFFVLLMTMAVFDQRRQLVVLGSIINVFGMGGAGRTVLDEKTRETPVEPGVMDTNINDLKPLTETLFDNISDLDFQENKIVQVVSVRQQALFEPGESALSANGRALLARMIPTILKVEQPLLLAGHTADLRQELGETYFPELDRQVVDPSWMLSLKRVLSVYHFFVEAGADPAKFRLEAFGRFRPRYGSNTPEDRRRNSSVDIVLDKSDARLVPEATTAVIPAAPIPQEQPQEQPGVTIIKDFEFDFKEPINRNVITPPGP